MNVELNCAAAEIFFISGRFLIYLMRLYKYYSTYLFKYCTFFIIYNLYFFCSFFFRLFDKIGVSFNTPLD